MDNARDTAEDATETTTDVAKGAASGGGTGSVREELTSIVREAALEVLTPVARKATLQAAKYAITQGPQYAGKNIPKLKGALDEAGGLGSAARQITGGLPERGRAALESTGIGRKKSESNKLPLQMSIDIAAPQDITYEELAARLPDMKAFRDGDVVDEERGVRLDWEGDLATAVITMHSLANDLTRVMVSYEMGGGGIRGALGGGLISRGLRSDLRRLKADLEMGIPEDDTTDEAPEAEAQEEQETPRRERKSRSSRRTKARAAEEPEDEEPEAEEPEDEEPEAEEPEASADEDVDAEADTDTDAEADEDEAPKAETTRRKPVRRRAPAGQRKPAAQRKSSRDTSRR